MSQVKYTWKQPIGGKTIVWRPLTGGDLMDLDTNYSRADVAPLRTYAQYAMRIVSLEGAIQQFQPNDFRSWDEIDINAFAQEVDAKDAMRLAALNGNTDQDAVKRLEKAADAVLSSVKKFGAELQLLLQVAKATESKTGPLKVSASPESSPQ